MGLFTKKPTITSSHAPIYTIGGQKTVLLVGLGNPGKDYDKTRHNIGFATVNAFVAANNEFSSWITKKDLKCQISSAALGGTRVIAIKPTTFMNNSGEAVRAVQDFYKITNENTLVTHDELDIDFGQLRTRSGGSSAGNNGIKSIISHCGASFGRLRIGINSPHRVKDEEKDFVLKPFNKAEQGQIKDLLRETTAIITEYIFSGELTDYTRNFLA